MTRKWLKIAGLICAVLLIPVVIVVTCTGLETPDAKFDSYGEAIKKGAVGPGKWLPSWLPTSAVEIREAHNIDTNLIWLEFSYPGALGSLDAQCTHIERGAMRAALPDLSSSFPREMRDSRSRLEAEPQVEALQCPDAHATRRWTLARVRGNTRLYAWTSPG